MKLEFGLSQYGASWRRLRGLQELKRRAFCYALALSSSPPAAVATVSSPRATFAERVSRVVPFARQLRQFIRRRPGLIYVDTSLLLVGAQGGHDAVAFADSLGELRLGSTPMEDSPHVRLLREAMKHGATLTDAQIRGSEYWAFAHWVADIDGAWFGAHDEDEFLEVTRNFIDWALEGAPRVTEAAGSPFDDHILVARIAGSPMMQVIDGHHRVAAAIVRGETSLRVNRTWLNSETPLQRRLHELSSSQRGAATLLQPLPAVDVNGWSVSADCTGRLLRMVQFLGADASLTKSGTFLDVGASYGWLLSEMKKFGYVVRGIEPDPRRSDVGASFLGIAPEEVVVGGLTESLENLADTYDVVSCFRLPEVFATHLGRDDAGRLIKAIDRVVDRVLFVDTDDHPDRASTGPTSGPGSLTQLLLDNTSFQRVVDLGANRDPIDGGRRTRLVALVRDCQAERDLSRRR